MSILECANVSICSVTQIEDAFRVLYLGTEGPTPVPHPFSTVEAAENAAKRLSALANATFVPYKGSFVAVTKQNGHYFTIEVTLTQTQATRIALGKMFTNYVEAVRHTEMVAENQRLPFVSYFPLNVQTTL